MASIVIQNYSQYPYSWADRRRDTTGALLHAPEPFYVPARGRDEESGALRPGLCRATEDSVKRARKNTVIGPLFKSGVLRVGSVELLGTTLELREHEGIMADEAAAQRPSPRQRPGVQLLTAAEMAQRAQ